jgi:glycosyltransferase involved in cell wall biosynthesis
MILLTSLLLIPIALSALLMLGMHRNASRYRIDVHKHKKASDVTELPTVSICIPARNEDHALQDCLSRVIATDYPKLEVIVLDDCSQDQTSQIIRSFAHEGVRFVQTKDVPESWLGKNYAYQTLLEQAHGHYTVFMSVDTRISVDSISLLIAHMERHKLSMVSVLPQRPARRFLSSIFAPLRVLWQLAWPLQSEAPVGTALWAVQRDELQQSGLLPSLQSTVFPERKIARYFASKNTYHFLGPQRGLGVWYEKKWSSQLHTSVRLWSPLLGHNVVSVTLAAMLHIVMLVAPSLLFVYSLFAASTLIAIATLSVVASGVMIVYYFRLLGLPLRVSLFGLLLPVYLGIQEIALILYSYYRYQRGAVEWKGRNVCYPRRFRTPD